MSRRFPFPLPRRLKLPHLLLLLLLPPLTFFLLSYTLLFHLLPPTTNLVESFRGRGPRDLFCGQVLRAYRASINEEEKGVPSPPPLKTKTKTKTSETSETSEEARKLKPRDLIERGPVLDLGLVGGGGGTISKLLHQSWTVEDLPRLDAHFAREWRQALGAEWEWVLWTDADNLLLVESLYPHLLDLYRSFPTEIYRADFSRNLYMHAFGGMYVDLDSSPLPSLPTLLNLFETYTPPPLPSSSNPYTDRPVAFLGQMDTSDVLGGGNSLKGVEHEIPNAWMASSRNHPFWVGEGGPVQRAAKGMERVSVSAVGGGKGRGYGKSPEWITGPITLRQSYLSYSNLTSIPSHPHPSSLSLSSPLSSPHPTTSPSEPPPLSLLAPLLLLPPPNIFPYSWTSDSNDLLSCTCSLQTRFYDEEWCKVLLVHDLKERHGPGGEEGSEAFFVSFWGHSWGGWGMGKKILGVLGGGKAKDPVSPYISHPTSR